MEITHLSKDDSTMCGCEAERVTDRWDRTTCPDCIEIFYEEECDHVHVNHEHDVSYDMEMDRRMEAQWEQNLCEEYGLEY